MSKHTRRIREISLNSVLVLAGVTIALFLSDWGLGLFGFPSEFVGDYQHPANHEEVRKNVEFQYQFRTNSRGLRYRDIPLKKPANSHRVYVAGDSFTEGTGVDDGKRFTDLLEARFDSSGTDVLFINGGLSGTGPATYGKLFLEVGLDYEPDALLLCLFVNDVVNTPQELLPNLFNTPPSRSASMRFAHRLWPRLHTQLQLLYYRREYHNKTKTTDFISTVAEKARRRNVPQSRVDRWKDSLPQELVSAINQGSFNGSTLSYCLFDPAYWSDSINISSEFANQQWNSVKSILAEILERAEQRGVETAVVLIPSKLQYDPTSHGDTNPWIISGCETNTEWLSEETEIQRRMRL